MREEKFLLFPAEEDIDECEGLTRQEMFEMLGAELGYDPRLIAAAPELLEVLEVLEVLKP